MPLLCDFLPVLSALCDEKGRYFLSITPPLQLSFVRTTEKCE